jgi:hypothetical protein
MTLDPRQAHTTTEPELFRGYGALDTDPDAAGHRCPMCGNEGLPLHE